MANKIELHLPSADSLFTTQAERDDAQREKILDIPLEDLHPFQNHPFHVVDNDELRGLAASIVASGVLTPALARPRPDGGYELVAGHRRREAARIAGLSTLPTVVRELDDDTATIVMVDSNHQRENLLPSEKAHAYKMKLDAIKRQAGRPKNNSSQVGTHFRSDQELAEQTDESRAQIQRYIRLTYLIPPLLQMVDEKRIAFSPAAELSYLPKKLQENVLEASQLNQCTPSFSQAVRMKHLHQQGELDMEAVYKIMAEEKANQREKLTFRADKFCAYFPKGYTADQMEKDILRLLEDRQKKQQRDHGAR